MGIGRGCFRVIQGTSSQASGKVEEPHNSRETRRKARIPEAADKRFSLHGKEGVDGSSPSEGLKYLQISYFCCLI